MERRGVQTVTPVVGKSVNGLQEVPMLNLKSNYIKNAVARKATPKWSSTTAPWQQRKSYFLDS